MHGGHIIAQVLAEHGVREIYALCGGHISPILVGAKERGIRVIDTRSEASAVFGADSSARLNGRVGVAAVTAGPGVTNAITAIQNARLAESPVLLLGGATATLLRGRGALQDIEQLPLLRPITKWAVRVEGLSALRPTLERAIAIATSGLPGPVFVEVPIDLLYPESVVREWTLGEIKLKGPLGAFLRFYANAHLAKQFHSPHFPIEWPKLPHPSDLLGALSIERKIERVAKCLGRSNRPLFIVGGQALALETMPERTAKAIEQIGAPTYLAGMARGLLGKNSRIQFRHARGEAIRRADFVLICGLPLDFRLKYGQGIPRSATLVLVNLNGQVLYRNRIPDIAIRMHPGHFLQKLAQALPHPRPDWSEWLKELEVREKAREQEIEAMAAAEPTQNRVNPLRFLIELEKRIDDDSIVIADGGDFVATASYILRPRRPLSWLDPGVFGTLGVGGGFALGAALSRPGAEIWILWGDGSSAYSLSEYDTFVRHNLAPIGVVGTDAAWSQIARDQKEILGDPVGTILRDTDYERVAQGYGALGLRIEKESEIGAVLEEAKRLSKQGKPVCINVLLAPSDFRKGSISV